MTRFIVQLEIFRDGHCRGMTKLFMDEPTSELADKPPVTRSSTIGIYLRGPILVK